MKKVLRFLVMFLLGGMFMGMVSLLGLTLYYRSNFPVNIWINGVYCTGKTVEQVNEELANLQEASVIRIADANRTYWEINMKEAGIRPDYTASLKGYLRQEAPFSWLDHFQEAKSLEITIVRYIFDEAKLLESFMEMPFVIEEIERENGVEVRNSENGYYFLDGNTKRLNIEKAYDYLKERLSKGETSVQLSDGYCYEDIADTAEDIAQRELWDKICEFVDCKIVYDMGTEVIELTPQIASEFLEKDSESQKPVTDEQGELVVSKSAVILWVEQLAKKYNTCDTEREFQSTRGDIVTVKYGTYGTEIDVEAEVEYLLNALSTDRTEVEIHIPKYIQEGYVRGLDDIGDTYIEVDMTEQKMYYYAEGELIVNTEVVTGDISERMGTPEGIYYVYNKQRNRTLRGPGYSSFVKYWMPVKGGVGIHDASWRSNFGGEIYKKSGSHGCINTPKEVMPQLYELAEIGTPVIMFY